MVTIVTARDCKTMVAAWLEDGTFAARLPEVMALEGVPQPPEYHGEGDAFTHTFLAIGEVDGDADPLVFWGVLLHDIGKSAVTEFIRGRWRSFGHEQAGAELVPQIMARLGFPELAADVTWLVRHHDFILSWEIRPEMKLTGRQRRFTEHPLFPLLLQVAAADAAASHGRSRKGEYLRILAELVEDNR
jgi:hypothetical protein